MAKKMDRIVSAVCDGYLGAVHRFVFGVDCEDTREMGETDNITEANWQTFSKGALWAQLKGSQSALTKALGELTETRAELNAAQAIVLQDAAERAETAALRAELEQARADLETANKRRKFAEDGEENVRFLKRLWEQECGFYLAKSNLFQQQVERDRRTIAALVRAGRAIYTAYRDELEFTYNAEYVPAIQRDKIRPIIEDAQAKQAGEA